VCKNHLKDYTTCDPDLWSPCKSGDKQSGLLSPFYDYSVICVILLLSGLINQIFFIFITTI